MITVIIDLPDRAGVLAEVTTLAERLEIKVIDLEIRHGPPARLHMVADEVGIPAYLEALSVHGYTARTGPVDG